MGNKIVKKFEQYAGIVKKVNMIDVNDWDNLVEETYGRP